MVDAAHDKEKKDRDLIKNLKEEVTNLTQITDQQTGFSENEEHRWTRLPPETLSDLLLLLSQILLCLVFFYSELQKIAEELTKERDRLMTTVEELRDKLNKAAVTQQETEAQKQRDMENITQVRVLLSVTVFNTWLCHPVAGEGRNKYYN